MTQPTFVPVADAASVRPCKATATPEIGRPKKAGLLGAPTVRGGSEQGSPGPDAGYALTLAERRCSDLHVEGVSHHDLVTGVALLAARRSARVGRAPTATDVDVAIDLLGLRSPSAQTASDARRRLAGVAHSYVEQRRLVDSVTTEALEQRPGTVVALAQLSPDH